MILSSAYQLQPIQPKYYNPMSSCVIFNNKMRYIQRKRMVMRSLKKTQKELMILVQKSIVSDPSIGKQTKNSVQEEEMAMEGQSSADGDVVVIRVKNVSNQVSSSDEIDIDDLENNVESDESEIVNSVNQTAENDEDEGLDDDDDENIISDLIQTAGREMDVTDDAVVMSDSDEKNDTVCDVHTKGDFLDSVIDAADDAVVMSAFSDSDAEIQTK
eukprot:405075_1